MISPAVLGCGALIGGGLFLLLREALPVRPDPEAILDRLESTNPPPAALHAQEPGAKLPWVERTGVRLLASFGHLLSVPRQDLALLGKTPAEHIGTKALGALAAFVMPQLFTALLALAGAGQLLAPMLLLSVLFAAVVWLNADHDVRTKAAKKRLEFRYAIASVLERAQLERGANSGVEAALLRTVAVGDHWIHARMRSALNRAELAGVPPWDALKQLGEQLNIPELAAPAESFSLAGAGAKIMATLNTQAQTLRTRLRTDKQAEANAALEKLVLPGTLVFAVVFAMFAYPAIHALTSV